MKARALAIAGADIKLRSAPGLYMGFSFRETGGTNAATAKIYDGTSASGTLLDTINLAAGASLSKYYEEGIAYDVGIYIDFGGTGTIEGSVRVGDGC